jgi:hypothetical protein
MEVKVFYNTGMDFWRMLLNVSDLYKKYSNSKMWRLEKGFT